MIPCFDEREITLHQDIDDDLELPIPDWIQRTAYELDKIVRTGHTSRKQVRQAIAFLGMIEIEEFCCPIPEVNPVTGRITFFWPATKGGIFVSVYDKVGRCVINYEKDFGVHTRRVGGPTLLRNELIRIYPFLRWRWERNTIT